MAKLLRKHGIVHDAAKARKKAREQAERAQLQDLYARYRCVWAALRPLLRLRLLRLCMELCCVVLRLCIELCCVVLR